MADSPSWDMKPPYRLFWVSDDHGGDWDSSDHVPADDVTYLLLDLARDSPPEIQERAKRLLVTFKD